MNKKQVLSTLELLHKISKKRKFKQTIDLIINLKELNLKKPEENINTFIVLPHERGKISRIGAFVGDELISKAKTICDNVIHQNDFGVFGKDKKGIKKLSKQVDFFVAQANLMPQIAASFGKILGPLGKMPNPKAGCVVPPAADLKILVDKLRKTAKVQTKNEAIVKVGVGLEDIGDDKLADNIMAIYDLVLHSLPQEKQNIKNIIIKTTMGKPFVVGRKEEIKIQEEKPKKEIKPKALELEKKEIKPKEKPKIEKKVKKKDGKEKTKG